jgi:hypothetical protein
MKIKIGDVFAISTTKGIGCLQYAHIDDQNIEFIRVLSGLFKELPPNFDELVRKKERFVIGFPLSAAFRRRIVERIGSYTVPDWFEMPRYFRDMHKVRGEFLGWHILDKKTWHRRLVKELSPAEKELSPAGIWNDTLLKERLVADWSLDNWGVGSVVSTK